MGRGKRNSQTVFSGERKFTSFGGESVKIMFAVNVYRTRTLWSSNYYDQGHNIQKNNFQDLPSFTTV